jgi:hypothetical protein
MSCSLALEITPPVESMLRREGPCAGHDDGAVILNIVRSRPTAERLRQVKAKYDPQNPLLRNVEAKRRQGAYS